jgi:hypothetical protein
LPYPTPQYSYRLQRIRPFVRNVAGGILMRKREDFPGKQTKLRAQSGSTFPPKCKGFLAKVLPLFAKNSIPS